MATIRVCQKDSWNADPSFSMEDGRKCAERLLRRYGVPLEAVTLAPKNDYKGDLYYSKWVEVEMPGEVFDELLENVYFKEVVCDPYPQFDYAPFEVVAEDGSRHRPTEAELEQRYSERIAAIRAQNEAANG